MNIMPCAGVGYDDHAACWGGGVYDDHAVCWRGGMMIMPFAGGGMMIMPFAGGCVCDDQAVC